MLLPFDRCNIFYLPLTLAQATDIIMPMVLMDSMAEGYGVRRIIMKIRDNPTISNMVIKYRL
jgi:hypothetical protein